LIGATPPHAPRQRGLSQLTATQDAIRTMVCAGCRAQRHEECRGGTWCDCQHQPPPKPETRLGWIRQG
ncbi:MAG TPA: hypothetical protein VK836_22180, partial [Streptosporangiaceae bacterium]|nr:hypothetical protein [Streptosporangiaceae bacterium]